MLEREDVDALYALDPSEFVAARKALAKQLKADGERDLADAVAGVKKPTKLAWAINQVARSRPDAIDALLDAGATLRDRQADALSGGDAEPLREAAAERREIVRTLAADVVALAGDGARDDAAAAFEVASIDDEVGAVVRAGRLTTLPDRPSDMGFAGMPDPPARPARRTAPRATSARRRGPDAEPPPPVRLDRKRIEKLERAVTTAERAAAEAADDLADAERRLDRAEEAVTAAEAKRDVAAEALETARRAGVAAAQALDRARTELTQAEKPS